MLTQTTVRMSHPTQALPLDYPFGDQLPEMGKVLAVAPGVLWLRMGLPFALDHINLWLLRDHLPHPTQRGVLQEGWTAVDCGIDNEATRQAWLQIEKEHLQGLPILRVLVTHMHPDHMGLAHWLCERWQAPLWMSTSEYQSAAMAQSGVSNFGGKPTVQFYQAHGWNKTEDLLQIQARVGYYTSMVPQVPKAYVRLMADDAVRIGSRNWRCISGYGHSPEHIALYNAQSQILISGDMLLPSISTNVSVYAQEPQGNALQLFLDSLTPMQDLPDSTLVLPSHGRPFKGAQRRIAQLRAHHDERLRELLQACSEQALSAHDALPVLFKRPLNVHQMTFAMGESVAHLHLLWLCGQLQRTQDAGGVYRFSSAQS
jgi:glyoxylase-like metal-dependent hydrolase (beta-lactamase superfamily II)